jgi:hypothetical protein
MLYQPPNNPKGGFMRRRKRRNKFVDLTFVLGCLFVYPLTLMPNNFDLPLAFLGGIFLFSGIVHICHTITKSGKNKFYKEIFNAIWNMETCIVFTMSITFFVLYQKNGMAAPDLISPFVDKHPYVSTLVAVILVTTSIFRFGLSFTDLFIKPEPDKQAEPAKANPD